MLFGVEKDSEETIRRRLSRRGSVLDSVAMTRIESTRSWEMQAARNWMNLHRRATG